MWKKIGLINEIYFIVANVCVIVMIQHDMIEVYIWIKKKLTSLIDIPTNMFAIFIEFLWYFMYTLSIHKNFMMTSANGYGWPKWTKSAKGSTYEKFHVRKHTRIKSFGYKTIRVSKVSCIKWYAYQKFRV